MMTIHVSWAWLEGYLLFCTTVIAVTVVVAVDHEILFSKSKLLYVFLCPAREPRLAKTEVREERPAIRHEQMVDRSTERVPKVA
jgi:hypothetical protein